MAELLTHRKACCGRLGHISDRFPACLLPRLNSNHHASLCHSALHFPLDLSSGDDMDLPNPDFAFTIPSVYDGTELSCRLYLPNGLHRRSPPTQTLRGAIVAHPYAPLGGCFDDPVVGFVGGELLEAGYVVGTFNFRGAADSQGRTSWTARPELADYVSFYGFMLVYLHMLTSQTTSSTKSASSSASGDDDVPMFKPCRNSADVHITLGGYSYGSMIASNLPSLDAIVELFKTSSKRSAFHSIFLAAEHVYGQSRDDSPTQQQPLGSPDVCWEDLKKSLESTTTTISYLLISPLLPPVNLFLTVFSSMWLEVGDSAAGKGKHIPCPKPAEQLCREATLALYGNEDTFTSASKLRKWAEDLKHVPLSKFESAEVDGAGHFWREAGAELQARAALRRWLHRIFS